MEKIEYKSDGDLKKYTFTVYPRGFCEHYSPDSDRLFSTHECWFCKYGDFALDTNSPLEEGLCTRGVAFLHSVE